MGAYAAIPLSGVQAPRQNPYQAMAEAEHNAAILGDVRAQQALRQEQLTAQSLANEQARQEAASQAAMREHLSASAGNLDKFQELISKDPRVGPQHVFGVQQNIANIVKSKAQASTADLQADMLHHDAVVGQFKGYDELPEDKRSWGALLYSIKPHLKPQDFEQLLTQYPTDPGAEGRKSIAYGMQFGSHILKAAVDQQKADAMTATAAARTTQAATSTADLERKKKETEAKLPELQSKSNAAVQNEWSGKLETAAMGDETGEAYTKTYHDALEKLGEPAMRGLPLPAEFDEDTAARVKRWGLSSNQKMTADLRVIEEEARATHEKRLATDSERRLAMADKRYALAVEQANKERQQTPNSIASTVNLADKLHAAAAEKEAKLIGELQAVQERLRNAGQTPEQRKSAKDPKTGRNLNDEYTAITNRIIDVVADKYKAYEKTGRPAPTVSYHDAIRGYREGLAAVLAGKDAQQQATKVAPVVPAPVVVAPVQQPAPVTPPFQPVAPPVVAAPVVAPPAAAPVVAQPAAKPTAPPPAKAAPKITVKLPSGEYVTGTQEKLDAYMKHHGFTLTKKQ